MLEQLRRLHETGVELFRSRETEALLYLTVGIAKELTGAMFASIDFLEGDRLHVETPDVNDYRRIVNVLQ